MFYFKYYTTTSKNCCILTNYITTEKLRTNKYVEHLLPQNFQQFLFQFHDIQLLGILLVSECRKIFFMCLCRTYFWEQQQPKVQDQTRFLFTFPTASPFFYFLQLHVENLLWYQHSLNWFYYLAESIVVLNFNIYFRSFDGCADDILMISCRLMSLQILIVSLSLLEILYAIKCFPKLTLAWMMKMSSIFKVL